MIWNLPSKKLKCSLCRNLLFKFIGLTYSCQLYSFRNDSLGPHEMSPSILAPTTVTEDMMRPSRSLEAVILTDFNPIPALDSLIFTQIQLKKLTWCRKLG